MSFLPLVIKQITDCCEVDLCVIHGNGNYMIPGHFNYDECTPIGNIHGESQLRRNLPGGLTLKPSPVFIGIQSVPRIQKPASSAPLTLSFTNPIPAPTSPNRRQDRSQIKVLDGFNLPAVNQPVQTNGIIRGGPLRSCYALKIGRILFMGVKVCFCRQEAAK